MKPTVFLAAVLSVVLLAGAVRAEMVLYDGMDYTAGGSLGGQSGGVGFGANAWTADQYTIVPGLTFSDMPVVGNAVRHTQAGSDNAQRLAQRQVSGNPNPSTLWTSYLVQPEVWATNLYTGLQINQTPSNVGAAVLRNAASGWSFLRGGVGVDNAITFNSTNALQAGQTYLLVEKFTGLNTTAVTGKWWALTVGAYEQIKTSGITEAELDAFAWSSAGEGYTFGSALSLDSTKYLQIQFVADGTNGGNKQVVYDEFRYGTSLQDAVPDPLPEPATLALLALGAGGLARYVRRRAARA